MYCYRVVKAHINGRVIGGDLFIIAHIPKEAARKSGQETFWGPGAGYRALSTLERKLIGYRCPKYTLIGEPSPLEPSLTTCECPVTKVLQATYKPGTPATGGSIRCT